jgi:hypothetical protein
MRGNKLYYLSAVYVFGLIMLLIGLLGDLHARARAVVLLVAVIPILALHIRMSFGNIPLKSMKGFSTLTLLWMIKFIVTLTNQACIFFFVSKMAFLDLVDFALLLLIAIVLSLSLIRGTPFFYERVRSTSVIVLGVALLLVSLVNVVMSVLAVSWFCREFLPSVVRQHVR